MIVISIGAINLVKKNHTFPIDNFFAGIFFPTRAKNIFELNQPFEPDSRACIDFFFPNFQPIKIAISNPPPGKSIFADRKSTISKKTLLKNLEIF